MFMEFLRTGDPKVPRTGKKRVRESFSLMNSYPLPTSVESRGIPQKKGLV